MENRIDRLFREKVARHEIQPSEEAWKAVNDKIGSRYNPMVWMRVAAAVVVLAVVGAVVFNTQDNPETNYTEFIASNTIDAPQEATQLEWKLEFSEKIVEEETTKSNFAASVSKVEEKTEVEASIEILEAPTLASIDEVDLTPSMTVGIWDMPVETMIPQLDVQITYIASAEKEDDKSKVGLWIEKARQLKPGEMLASIRESKNDFFNGKRN